MSRIAADVTLGILAGGRATRLGGIDKAWIERDGVPQVIRIAGRFAPEVGSVVVASNTPDPRYARTALRVVSDATPQLGPLGGLEALCAACDTPWLFTVPVDAVDFNDCLLRSLRAARGQGAYAQDQDGVQPLVALWPVARTRAAVASAIAARACSIQELQARLGMGAVRFAGFRFGNINTPQDLAAAGIPFPPT